MTKIYNIKSKIKDLKITIDEAITIQILNLFDLFFTQFPGILSYNAKKKTKLFIFESLTKLLKDKKL